MIHASPGGPSTPPDGFWKKFQKSKNFAKEKEAYMNPYIT